MVKLTILCHPLTPVAPAELGGWLSKQADRLRSSASLIVHLSQLTQGRKIAAGWYRMHRPMCPERPWTWTYKPRGTLRDGSTPITRGRGAEKSLVQIQSSPITSHQLRKQRARLQRPRRPPRRVGLLPGVPLPMEARGSRELGGSAPPARQPAIRSARAATVRLVVDRPGACE